MILNDVHQGIHKNKKRKRIGRGPGSGHGKTSGRGHKGYFSRSGSKRRQAFAGGSTPLMLLVAKRGFSNAAFADKVLALNVSTLGEKFGDGETVSRETLRAKGLAKTKFDALKILGDGELTKKLTVHAEKFSASAEQKITAAGGECVRVTAR